MTIAHKTLNERAYDEIRQGLVTGDFKPGQVLVIRTLASLYGISITPVRDALQRLVAEQLLTMQSNRSIVVPFLSDESLIELVRIRSELEGFAAELATPNIRLADLAKLEDLVVKGRDAIQARDGRKYVAINRQFHFAIYERAGSPMLLKMIVDMWTRIGPFLNRLFDDPSYVEIANDEHETIVAAIGRGDAAAVRRHISLDIQIAASSLRDNLPSLRTERDS
ncbi:GntR family transcriptional regulator [Paraburkholderia sp.]|uniref:GntR family transcriptional regulator n=1 Tax=Paraburkholderia sp. TaxID=1926495 RepID=UPI0039E6AE99